MDYRPHWRGGGFDGRSPHQRHPRFRGGGGNYNSPRHFGNNLLLQSPQWQQRSPSPYHRYPSQQHSPYGFHQSPYDPHAFSTSTPVHSGGRRPFFRGGGGRFSKRPSFGSYKDRSGSDDVDNWISPEMWNDPWRHLTKAENSLSAGTTQESSSFLPQELSTEISSEVETGGATKFAESDFSVAESVEAEPTSFAKQNVPTPLNWNAEKGQPENDNDDKSVTEEQEQH